MKRRRNDILCVVMVVLCVAALFMAWLLLLDQLSRRAARLEAPVEVVSSAPAVALAERRVETVPRPVEPTYDPAVPLDEDLQYILMDACEVNVVGYPLALGLIEVESGFDPAADNGLCYGLCQLNRAYFPDGLPAGENIREGMKYLGRLLREYDTPEAALTAYNAGYDTGDRDYAQRVLNVAGKWGEM